MDHRGRRWLLSFLLLVFLLIALFWAELTVGTAQLTVGQVWELICRGDRGSFGGTVVLTLRLPRTLAACLLGGALGVSGFLLQTFFANPIAGPFVLGVSSGGKLAVALALVLTLRVGGVLTGWTLIGWAFCGSLLSMGLVLVLAPRVGRLSLLVVCGVMIGYLCNAVTEFLTAFADDADIVNLHNWSMGSFSGIRLGNLGVIAWVVLPSVAGSFLLSKPMSAYQQGEGYARSVGVDLGRLRVGLILLSSLLSAVVTAFAGPVSFVGVAVPHLIRNLFRTGKPLVMVPACFLGGGVFCLLCDLIARIAFAPTELSVSAVTALFGAPVVLYMLVRKER